MKRTSRPRMRSFVVAATATTLGIVATVPATAGVPFASFGATSEAAGVAFKVVYSGFASLFPIVDASVAHVSGALDSRPNARGYSSAVDPGQAIQSLGALGVPMPPYPFFARAEFPGAVPRAHTSMAEQEIGPGVARMIVSDVVAAEGPRLEALGLAGSFEAEGILSTGSVMTYTTMSAGEKVAATTDVVVNDIVVGGTLRIAKVHTTVTATSGGAAGTSGAVPRVKIVDATLAGESVTIDDEGIQFTGNGVFGPGGSATDLADAAGISVSLGGVDSTVLPDGSAATARAEGLLVKMKIPDGSVVEFRIGTALATATAVLAAAEEPPPPAPVSPPPTFVAPIEQPGQPPEYVQPSSPPAPVQRVAAHPLELPGNLVGVVAAAQFGFWAIVGLLGWWSRPRTQAAGREWFFDTIDRVQAADHI